MHVLPVARHHGEHHDDDGQRDPRRVDVGAPRRRSTASAGSRRARRRRWTARRRRTPAARSASAAACAAAGRSGTAGRASSRFSREVGLATSAKGTAGTAAWRVIAAAGRTASRSPAAWHASAGQRTHPRRQSEDSVHIVIMGCGRVGSTLAHSLEARGHSVAVIDQNPDAFRRLGADFAGLTVTGVGFDREVLHRGRHRAGRRVRRRLQRRQLQHHLGPAGPRDVRRARGSSPASTTSKRAEVYERLGIPTVATVRWTADRMVRHLVPEGMVELWRDPTSTVVDRRGAAARGLDRPRRCARSRRPAAPGWRTSCASASARCPPPSTVLQDGDQVFMLVTDDMVGAVTQDRRRAAAATGRALTMRVAIAGAGNVGRSIAQELIENGHQVLLIERQPRHAAPRAGARRPSGSSPTPASWPACRRPTWPAATWWSPRPATTRSTWWCRCWPRPSSRCRGWWPGSTGPRTSGCSPSSGASTSRSASRA